MHELQPEYEASYQNLKNAVIAYSESGENSKEVQDALIKHYKLADQMGVRHIDAQLLEGCDNGDQSAITQLIGIERSFQNRRLLTCRSDEELAQINLNISAYDKLLQAV